jgi:hypothetical protein
MYTPGQRNLMCKLSDFLYNDKIYTFKLTGGAGTGKTFCLSRFLKIHKLDYNIITTAPTHKAVCVLRNNIKDKGIKTCTIHQVLGYSMVYTENGDQTSEFNVTKFETFLDPTKKTILVIDEISMIGDVLFEAIKNLHKKYLCKLILTGDNCQLPAMETKSINNKQETYSKISNIFKYYDDSFNLTEIKRTDKKIMLETYQIFRDYVLFNDYDDFTESLNKLKKNKNKFVKFVNYQDKFDRYITKAYKRTNETTNVIVTSKNKVSEYNEGILNEIYPDLTCTWNIDQPFYFTEYYDHSAYQKFYTSNRGIVLNVRKENKYSEYFEKYFDVINLTLGIFDDDNNICNRINVNVINPDFTKKNKEIISDFKSKLKIKIKLNKYSKTKITETWKEFFYNKKNIDCPIVFCYCITAYKSQGSTYDNVFIDMNNILMCRRNSPLQLCRELYTAISRTRTNLVIFLNFNNINNKKKCSRCHSIKDSENFINKLNKEFKLCLKCRLSSNKNRNNKKKSIK